MRLKIVLNGLSRSSLGTYSRKVRILTIKMTPQYLCAKKSRAIAYLPPDVLCDLVYFSSIHQNTILNNGLLSPFAPIVKYTHIISCKLEFT